MSIFDPTKFMESNTSEAGSLNADPVPPGDYQAVIDGVEFRPVELKKTGEERMTMRISWNIVDDELKATLDRDKVIVRQDIWLDVARDNSGLDFGRGKNVGLNRVRDALNQNNAGEVWNPGMLVGAGPAMISVTQRPGEGARSDAIYNDVKSVGRLI